eukprot:3165600-Pyramimonas_sp.AAC.1
MLRSTSAELDLRLPRAPGPNGHCPKDVYYPNGLRPIPPLCLGCGTAWAIFRITQSPSLEPAQEQLRVSLGLASGQLKASLGPASGRLRPSIGPTCAPPLAVRQPVMLSILAAGAERAQKVL